MTAQTNIVVTRLERLRAEGNKILDFQGWWTSRIFRPHPIPQHDSLGRGSPYERWVDDAGVKRIGDTANSQFISRTFAAGIFCRDHLSSRVPPQKTIVFRRASRCRFGVSNVINGSGCNQWVKPLNLRLDLIS
jgi:hypothetical protein